MEASWTTMFAEQNNSAANAGHEAADRNARKSEDKQCQTTGRRSGIPPSPMASWAVWFTNAHRIEMRGESMRKKRNPPQDEKKE